MGFFQKHMQKGCLRPVQACSAGQTLVQLPPACQLTIDAATDERLLKLADKVPQELWGAKLALQVSRTRRVSMSAAPFPARCSAL